MINECELYKYNRCFYLIKNNDIHYFASDFLEEELDDDLNATYNAIISKLSAVKSEAISGNKEQLKTLLENEIIKRYFYREGLYKYFLANNTEVKKAANILANPNEYKGYLKP